jgi:hypothetical protein
LILAHDAVYRELVKWHELVCPTVEPKRWNCKAAEPSIMEFKPRYSCLCVAVSVRAACEESAELPPAVRDFLFQRARDTKGKPLHAVVVMSDRQVLSINWEYLWKAT